MSENVKVIVRCRPLNEKEITSVVVCVDPIERQVTLTQKAVNVSSPNKVFTFDSVYGTGATNEEIYHEDVSPLVDSILQGYNGCIFAYGQTSCGKTFSMQGQFKGFNQPPSQQGIMSRTFEQIFEYIQTTDVDYYAVKCSYLEIYNEEIRDLLHKQNGKKLDVKEHPEKGVYVKDLTTVDVTCVEDMEEVLEVGSWNRVLGATAQNPDSSRSHCIFTIEFELCFTTEHDDHEQFRSGRLNLVDLAGSERQGYSRAEGERFKEATKINLSLSALGNVISALVKEDTKHIPYRASKLTRLLQDSLGGNSRTLMIACICPGANNYGETLSTLRYANRAKNIKNRPIMNEDPKDKLIRQYQNEIQVLQQLLAHQSESKQSSQAGSTAGSEHSNSSNNNSNRREKRREKEGRRSSSSSDRDLDIEDSDGRELSRKERLRYEETIDDLQEKYDTEQTSKERLDTSLKSVQSEYNNYRLKHEYKIRKLKSEFKMKIKRLREIANANPGDNESVDTGFASLASRELSDMSDNFMLEKNGTLSSLSENSHLWSYQWLKCYCDSGKRWGSRAAGGSLDHSDEDIQCICTEENMKGSVKTEKAIQTCPMCINQLKGIMADSQRGNVVTSQPNEYDFELEKRGEKKKKKILLDDEETDLSRLCCIKSIRLFG